MISIKLNKFIGLILFILLLIFPFSFQNLNAKWNILFAVALGFLLISLFLNQHFNFKKPLLLTVLTVLFLVLFDFTEKVNFDQLFNIQNPLGWRIPLSTILLSIATLAFIIKIMMGKKLIINLPEYFKFFFAAIVFLIVLTVLFYPFMRFHYNMALDSNFELLNKVFKYALLFMFVLTYLRNERAEKKANIGLAISISAGLLLNLFL